MSLLSMNSLLYATELDESLNRERSETVVESGGYLIYYRGTEDGQGGILVLTKGGKMVDSSEDVFFLISKCDNDQDKANLTTEYVKQDIDSHGGRDAYQEAINKKIKAYGAGFFNFLPKSAIEEYSRQGIKFD